jgi:excisionase family DNA binding protein
VSDLPVMDREMPTAVKLADGSEVKLNADQARLVRLALGDEETVSPQDAAFLLGVSRPMVVRWIREGLLQDRKTGSHHKIPLSSVQTLKQQRSAAGRDAVAAVAASKSDPSAGRRTAAARQRAQARIARRDTSS